MPNIKHELKSQNVFFSKRLEAYIKIAELNWQTYHVTQKIEECFDCFPTVYKTFRNLKEWNDSISQHIDKNRLLLDQDTYRAFDKLNNHILSSINQLIKLSLLEEESYNECRKLEREKCSEVQKLSEGFMEAARIYINKTIKGCKIKVEIVV